MSQGGNAPSCQDLDLFLEKYQMAVENQIEYVSSLEYFQGRQRFCTQTLCLF